MLTLADVIEALTNTRPSSSTVITEAGIDSRQVIPSSIFVAIPGERVDGHNFIADAFRRGAAFSLIQRDVDASFRTLAELDALDLEYKPILEATAENIAALENEIKTDVLLYGESVSGGMYRASYTQGRVSWDNEGMTKYAALHPDVLQFRKQGQPAVSLRVVRKD